MDNVIRIGVYFSLNWENFFTDLSSTVGFHFIDSTHNIWNGTTARARHTGTNFNANGIIDDTFNLPVKFQIIPTFSLEYTMLHDPNYTETGSTQQASITTASPQSQ